jgi:hypothetical protein
MLKHGRIVAEGLPRDVVRTYLGDLRTARKSSVRDWHNRESNGQARIVQFEVSDAGGNRGASIPMGGDVQFTIVAEFYEPVLDPGFGVGVETAAGEPILNLRSAHAGLRLGRVQGTVTIHGTLPALGLYPGEYLLSPWITDSLYTESIDWAKHCATLHVHPAPGPHGDLKLDANYGKYWAQSHWWAGPPNDGSQPPSLDGPVTAF